MTLAPLAPHPICRDFEADVLGQLRKARATLHGCPVAAVGVTLDGGVEIWFAGRRDGVPWRGALRFEYPWLAQRRYAADSHAVAQTALQLLATIAGGPRALRPLIERGDAPGRGALPLSRPSRPPGA